MHSVWEIIKGKAKRMPTLDVASLNEHSMISAQIWHKLSRDLTVLSAHPPTRLSSNGMNHTCLLAYTDICRCNVFISFQRAYVVAVLTTLSMLFIRGCFARPDGWQRRNDPMKWEEFHTLIWWENTKAAVWLARCDRQTDHRCSQVTYECRPPRPLLASKWKKTHTCLWCFDERSECSSSKHTNIHLSYLNKHCVRTGRKIHCINLSYDYASVRLYDYRRKTPIRRSACAVCDSICLSVMADGLHWLSINFLVCFYKL